VDERGMPVARIRQIRINQTAILVSASLPRYIRVQVIRLMSAAHRLVDAP
jgi:hypothetical protein